MPWRFIPALDVPMVTPAWTVTVVVDAPVPRWRTKMPWLLSWMPEFGSVFALPGRWVMATRLAVALAPPTVSARPPKAPRALSRVMPFASLPVPLPEVTVHGVEPPGTSTVATLPAPGATSR